MPGKMCCVCGNKEKQYAHVSFHRFPVQEEVRMKWIEACKLTTQDTKLKYVCSNHFKDEDYDEFYFPRRKLIAGATPTPSNIYFVSSTLSPESTYGDSSPAEPLSDPLDLGNSISYPESYLFGF